MRPLARLNQRFPLTAMIAAMLVWIAHFTLVYGVVGLSCERPETLGRSAAAGWVVLASLAAITATLALGVASLRRWRREQGTARFLAGTSALLALLALIAMALVLLPVPWLPACIGWGSHAA